LIDAGEDEENNNVWFMKLISLALKRSERRMEIERKRKTKKKMWSPR